ncbi:unnamed protein product [Plutella xylostella]|uniref:(diamondback moth) hypothetical protein n=1 Tax=Plutella xylostella TaxID=51655 RepID=A0A8S4G3U5_PLUXY|nr:unnamed protein product [Plutella xylostella]
MRKQMNMSDPLDPLSPSLNGSSSQRPGFMSRVRMRLNRSSPVSTSGDGKPNSLLFYTLNRGAKRKVIMISFIITTTLAAD